MRTVPSDLRTLLDDAQLGTFVIPRFQRDFVWQIAQVKLLVDSVARNFPIGSLLLLEEPNPRSPFLSSRAVDAALRTQEFEDDGSESGHESQRVVSEGQAKRFYVLDGQQRLTSLVRVFLQASPRVNFYFDLQKLYELDKDQTDWVITRRKAQSMPRRYLRPEVVRDAETCQVLVEEYFEKDSEALRGDRASQRKASARVNRIFETMRNYQVPIVIIDRSESHEAICRIFETINSTGTRLTTFDLAVARFFPLPDLHELLTAARLRHPTLERYEVEGERILQVVAGSMHTAKGNYPEVTRSAVLSLPREEIIARWDESAASLSRAYDWIEEHGAVPGLVANENLVVPLALFLGIATDAWKRDHPGCMATLERWYFANCLQQGARQASNYRSSQNISQLCNWVQLGTTLEVPAVSLNLDGLLKLRKADNRYGAVHALMRWRCKTDLWTDDVIDTKDVEDHHIFPAAMCRRDGLNKRLLDSIANRLLVATKTNRSLGDQPPRDYMGKLFGAARTAGTLVQKKRILRDTCIPPEDTTEAFAAQFAPAKFEDFVQKRGELILQMVADVLGDAFQSKVIDEQDDED